MMKLALHWNVTQTAGRKKRSPSEVAKEIEESMLKKGTQMHENPPSAKLHHLQLLRECTFWVQEQCQATPSLSENDALTTTLSSINSWLEIRRHSLRELREGTYVQQRMAIKEELVGNKRLIPFEIQSYAFAQHAMRELRASIHKQVARCTKNRCAFRIAGTGRTRTHTNDGVGGIGQTSSLALPFSRRFWRSFVQSPGLDFLAPPRFA